MEKNLTEVETDEFVDVETADFETGSNEIPVINSIEEEKDDYLDEHDDEKPDIIDYNSIGEFCFESDELALKSNTDYKNLLETIVVLESQRARAVKDLKKLEEIQEEALTDPFAFVERLQNKEKIHFPSRQKIYPIPPIDWSKYSLGGNPSAFEKRQNYLISRQILQDSSQTGIKCSQTSKSDVEKEEWTDEEDAHLKDLLSQFPISDGTDPFQWERIAKQLKTHSPIQVVMRVCELFLPSTLICPENMPDLKSLQEHWKTDREGNSFNDKSSFLKSTSDLEISDEEEISPDLYNTEEFQELVLLKRVLREKLNNGKFSQQVIYQCYRCGTEPIAGVRWHCVDCKPPSSVDFCDDCARCMYETEEHTAEHQLERHHINKGFLDRDYMHFLGNDYNYLDPNYMPAT